jgi:DNA-binding transcriptional ArsR family regulator
MSIAQDQNLDRIFHALSDTTRRVMLRQMAKGERTVSQLAEPHELTLAAISKHLKVLESSGLVRRRKSGSYQMITLNPEALKTADQWLNYYEEFWSSRLSSLKKMLENSEEKS